MPTSPSAVAASASPGVCGITRRDVPGACELESTGVTFVPLSFFFRSATYAPTP